MKSKFVMLASVVVFCTSSFAFEVAKTTGYPSLQMFLTRLNKAIQARDKAFIYSKVSTDFVIHRDFGGGYNKMATQIENFSYVFQLDNAKLKLAYQDHDWEKLKKSISIQQFQISPYSKVEVCEKITYDKLDFPSDVLCFKKLTGNAWVISSFINGGD